MIKILALTIEFHALTKIYIVYIVRVSIFTQVWVHQTRAAFTKVILIIMMMMTLMINYLKYGWPTKKFSSIFFLSVFCYLFILISSRHHYQRSLPKTFSWSQALKHREMAFKRYRTWAKVTFSRRTTFLSLTFLTRLS